MKLRDIQKFIDNVNKDSEIVISWKGWGGKEISYFGCHDLEIREVNIHGPYGEKYAVSKYLHFASSDVSRFYTRYAELPIVRILSLEERVWKETKEEITQLLNREEE